MRALFFLIGSVFHFLAVAQPTITNAYFPAIGNNLITAKATNGTAYRVDLYIEGGSNVPWDFRIWRPQALDTQRFVSPDTEGSRLFPLATMTLKPDTTAQVPFYRRTDTTLELMGLKGLFFQGLFIPIVVKPHSTLKERRAPLRLGSVYNQTAGFQVTFPTSLAPDSLLLNSPFAVPDSVRITYDVRRRDSIDAWGTVRIPNGDFVVLRELRRENIKAKVEILYSFLGWLDVTTLVLTGLSQPFYPERVFLNYYNATTQEPIAVIETNLTYAVLNAQYKAIGQRVGTQDFVDFSDAFSVFPNPAHDKVFIDFEKINVPIAAIQAFDFSGRLVFNQQINHEKTVKMAVNNWQNGAYLICLLDKENRILGKKMFIKN
jgi:hypothetical protein